MKYLRQSLENLLCREDNLFSERPPTEARRKQSSGNESDLNHMSCFTGLEGDVIEILVGLYASANSDTCLSCRVAEAHVLTKNRHRDRLRKRLVEDSVRNLTRSDRDAFTKAKQDVVAE